MSGIVTYANRVTSPIFSRAESTKSKRATIKSGQVLKARSFLQSDSEGKLIAHSGIAESAQATFAAVTAGQTVILGGLTYTDGGSGTTGAQLATAWAGLYDGITAAAATTLAAANGIDASIGTFTAGTLSGWNTDTVDSDTVVFTATTLLTNVTDLAATGTGAGSVTIETSAGVTAKAEIAGMTIYDVNAASADVDAEVFVEAAMWADAITWLVNVGSDTVTNDDGTTTSVTAYNTGTTGYDSDSTRLMREKFLEGSKFRIDTLTEGEVRDA